MTAADETGLWTLQTSIFPENRRQIALHHSAGYRTLGIRERIGHTTAPGATPSSSNGRRATEPDRLQLSGAGFGRSPPGESRLGRRGRATSVGCCPPYHADTRGCASE